MIAASANSTIPAIEERAECAVAVVHVPGHLDLLAVV
jgi:hypothetical protein